MHPCIIFFKWSQLGAHYFVVYLFQILYMFQATMCPSSGEITVSMRQWYFSLCMCGFLVCRPESHPYQLGAHYFLVYLFQILYMFQATMCHHQENLLYLCDTGWLSGRQTEILNFLITILKFRLFFSLCSNCMQIIGLLLSCCTYAHILCLAYYFWGTFIYRILNLITTAAFFVH